MSRTTGKLVIVSIVILLGVISGLVSAYFSSAVFFLTVPITFAVGFYENRILNRYTK